MRILNLVIHKPYEGFAKFKNIPHSLSRIGIDSYEVFLTKNKAQQIGIYVNYDKELSLYSTICKLVFKDYQIHNNFRYHTFLQHLHISL